MFPPTTEVMGSTHKILMRKEKKNRKIIRLDRDQAMAIWVFLGASTCGLLLIAEVIREVLNR